MGIKTSHKTVYTCSDGTEFTDERKAKDHEFDTTCPQPSNAIGFNPKEMREWLLKHKNFVLRYIGREFDPEAEEETK